MLSAFAPLGEEHDVERRKHPRKLRDGNAWILREHLSRPDFRVPLVDLSLSGVLFHSPIFPEKGEDVRLRIQFSGGPMVQARARVSRRSTSGFACAFSHIDDDDFYALRVWMGANGQGPGHLAQVLAHRLR